MNIKDDSRKVVKGDIFVALKKINDGHKYVIDAIKNGVLLNEKIYSKSVVNYYVFYFLLIHFVS